MLTLPFTISLFANCSHIWRSHVCQIAGLWLHSRVASNTSPKRQLKLRTVQGQENCLSEALGVIRHSFKNVFSVRLTFLKEGIFLLLNFPLSSSKLKACFGWSLLERIRECLLWWIEWSWQFCPGGGSEGVKSALHFVERCWSQQDYMHLLILSLANWSQRQRTSSTWAESAEEISV